MRVLNRVLAVAAALTLAAGGVLVIVEIGLAAAGQGPWLIPYDNWYAGARNHSWSSGPATTLFIIVAVIGAVLLGLQVARPTPRSVPLDDGATRAGITRRSVEQTLARAAGNERGVAGASARIRRRRAKVAAASIVPPDEVRSPVEEATERRLRDLGLDGRLGVAVNVRQRHR